MFGRVVKAECSRNVESIVDVTIFPGSGGLPDEMLFDHPSGIGEMQLEYVPSCLNIHPDGDGIVIGIRLSCCSLLRSGIRKCIVIFS